MMTQRTQESATLTRQLLKGYRSEPAKWRHTQGKVCEGPNHRASVSSLMESGCVTFPAQCVHQPGSYPWEASGSRHFTGVSLHRHSWLNHGWTLSPAPFSSLEVGRSGWYHVAQSPSSTITWLDFLAWPVTILSHLISINSHVVEGPTMNSHHAVSLRKFQGFKGYLPGSRNKNQKNSIIYNNP